MMERTRFLGIHNMPLVQEIGISQLVSEETAADIDLFTPHDDDLLPSQNLLGDNRGQAAEKVTLAINDDRGVGKGGHIVS